MKGLVGGINWEAYKQVIQAANSEFAQKPITHLVWNMPIDVNHEDFEDGTFTPRTLLVLQNHNYMRTWPATKTTESGELDKESIQLFLNKRYLSEQGWISPKGNYNFNPDYDRFIIDGIVYKSFGDTGASQANAEDLQVLLILKREENQTTDFKLR